MGLLTAMMKTRRADGLTREETARLQRRRLAELVRFARENSPFYRRLYAGIPDEFRLEDLPPVTKPEMMAAFDDVLTDRRVTMRRIEEFTADTDNIGRMIDGRYLVFRTSGSTGHPAVVLYDGRMIGASSAVAALRAFARKEDFRAFMRHGKRTAGVFADHGFYLACGMSRYMQLKMPGARTKITVDVNLPEEEIVQKLNAFGPAMLSGYPSNLSLLADHEELTIRPDVVLTGGELLTDAVRKKLADKFRCTVQTHYSCTEAGEIACECAAGHLHLNGDWVIAEPVMADNTPAGYGALSDKVLVTNLANRVQPFIRYELTDRVIVHDDPCACGRKSQWLEIEGRTDDTLTFAGGVKIAPMSLYKIMEEVKSVRRFQLVQTAPDKLLLRLTGDNPEEAFAEAERALRSFFASAGAGQPQIALSAEEPRADPVSGKFKHVIAADRM